MTPFRRLEGSAEGTSDGFENVAAGRRDRGTQQFVVVAQCGHHGVAVGIP